MVKEINVSKSLLALTTVALFSLGAVGCEQESAMEESMEETGENIEQRTDRLEEKGDTVENKMD